MEESSDWSDESDILNSQNFFLNDEQLEYAKKNSSKENVLSDDLDQIKSLISEIHDSRGFVTLRGEIFVMSNPELDTEITHVHMHDYPRIAVVVYSHAGNIDFITFSLITSKTSVRIPPPKLLIIEDENDCDN
jgi:hypothetical protein